MGRLEAVRRGAPDARLVVDANEGWTAELYAELAPALARLGVEMVEQPLPAGEDAALGEMAHTVPVCADESCHDRASLAELRGRYDFVNVKLDKTGGLTEALALVPEARAMGFRVMVGCMMTSSLGVAPAVLLAQDVDLADLDPPMMLASDRDPPLKVAAGAVYPPEPELWG
jgi:L-alanine-DL-glutamate epimerase-like enolase superfamily enzyme